MHVLLYEYSIQSDLNSQVRGTSSLTHKCCAVCYDMIRLDLELELSRLDSPSNQRLQHSIARGSHRRSGLRLRVGVREDERRGERGGREGGAHQSWRRPSETRRSVMPKSKPSKDPRKMQAMRSSAKVARLWPAGQIKFWSRALINLAPRTIRLMKFTQSPLLLLSILHWFCCSQLQTIHYNQIQLEMYYSS